MRSFSIKAVVMAMVVFVGVAAVASGAGQGESAAEDVELEIWHWETPPHRVERMGSLLEQYESETGVTVKQVPTNFPDYQTKILSAISANQLPDMMFINPTQVTLLRQQDAIVDISDLFDELDDAHSFPAALASPYNIDGKQWGIPIYGVFWPMTYRQDLYEEAGLDPPVTWEETLNAAEQLTQDRDGDGQVDVYGFLLPVSANGNYGSQVVWSFLRSNGGQIVSTEGGSEEIVFDSEATRETYRFLAGLAEYTAPGAENMDWGQAERLIRSGRASTVMYNGAWIRALAEDDPQLLGNYSMELMPSPEGGRVAHTGYPRAIVLTESALENKEAVYNFMRWLYQPEHQAEVLLMEAGLFMPVTEAAANSERFNSNEIIAANQQLIDKQFEAGSSIEIIGFVDDTPSLHASEIESSFLLGQVLQKIVLSGWSVERAVSWGAEEYRKIIAD